MKPRNFPGRANTRRKGALKRMGNPPIGTPQAAEHAALKAKIVDDSYARGLRSKKDHSRMAKLRETA